ncbi:hypothetical protein FRC12_020028 [Ceratobasidium sp. 428]|nr:hypothetical protein FRC12_020028 [Ceratobasidium sp. 428]
MGGNQMLLGSNISGLYSAPDYSSLAPSNGSVPPFTTTVLRTLLDIDLSQSNESISSFDLSSESHASLLSRNISSALISEIVSTQLKDCQPVSIPPSPSFGFLIENNFITYAEQNLSSTSGGISQLREELFANPSLFTTSKYQTYTFLMTHAASTTPSPADDSQVMILLAYKAAQCAPGPFETPFGPMPHGLVNTSVTYLVNSSFPHNHAALACRNVRTITRTVYAPDGNQVEHTSQSFYAKPALSTLNRLYLYFPVMSRDYLTESLLIAKYGGIGALLNKDMIYTTGWRLPGCTYGTATSGNSTADLDAISTAWGKAVARVQHYETTILQAFVKQNTSFVSMPVLIATPAYRLALMPGALFIYGLAMTITACLLIVLLALGDHNRRSLSVKSLSLWRVADKLGTVRDSEPEDVQAEKSERSLRRDLGMVRIRRRARAAV